MNKKLKVIISIVIICVIGVSLFFLLNRNVKIKFDSNGGSMVETLVIKKGTKTKLPRSTKENYNFVGWYLDGKRILSNYVFKKNVTLVAKWDDKFKITFTTSGGSRVESITLKCGEAIKLPQDPTKKKFKFKGWKLNNGTTLNDGDILPCRNTNVFAIWERK